MEKFLRASTTVTFRNEEVRLSWKGGMERQAGRNGTDTCTIISSVVVNTF